VYKEQKQNADQLIRSLPMDFNRYESPKTGELIHLQDKIGHSSKKVEQSQRHYRILTLKTNRKQSHD